MPKMSSGICGLLHFAPGRAASELRHLAVRADCRRQGIANALFDAYMSVTGGQKSLVWARIGNEAAERFYETHDYRPTDGIPSCCNMEEPNNERTNHRDFNRNLPRRGL